MELDIRFVVINIIMVIILAAVVFEIGYIIFRFPIIPQFREVCKDLMFWLPVVALTSLLLAFVVYVNAKMRKVESNIPSILVFSSLVAMLFAAGAPVIIGISVGVPIDSTHTHPTGIAYLQTLIYPLLLIAPGGLFYIASLLGSGRQKKMTGVLCLLLILAGMCGLWLIILLYPNACAYIIKSS